MMKIFLCFFVLISYCSGFFLGGLLENLGGSKPPEKPKLPPPQRHLVKILSVEPRSSNSHGLSGVLNSAVSGSLNNGPSGLLNNGPSGLLNNGHGLVDNGLSGSLNNGQSGLLNNGVALNSIGAVSVIRVIHEGLPLTAQLAQPRVIRIIHERAQPTNQNLASTGTGGFAQLGPAQLGQTQLAPASLPQVSTGAAALAQASLGAVPLGQVQLGTAQLAPLITSPPASLLSSGPGQSYSYPPPLHHSNADLGYSYKRGG